MTPLFRALPITAAVFFAACGSDASMTMHLMDAPPVGVTSVRLTVAAMQVHVAKSDDGTTMADPADTSIDDDDKWVSLSVGRTIDLVLHQGETAADVLGELTLPEGKITQIRLILDTSTGDKNVATYNGSDCQLDVEKVAKKGVKIEHPFKAFRSYAGRHHDVYVDFLLDKSLKSKGACFELEPKLKLHKVKLDGEDEAI